MQITQIGERGIIQQGTAPSTVQEPELLESGIPRYALILAAIVGLDIALDLALLVLFLLGVG